MEEGGYDGIVYKQNAHTQHAFKYQIRKQKEEREGECMTELYVTWIPTSHIYVIFTDGRRQ